MQSLYRIIDANMNRAREGLRVIEDIIRFCVNDKRISRELKKMRHDLSIAGIDVKKLITSRNSRNDIGRQFDFVLEGKSKKIKSLVVSNFRRVEESLRVLEEIYKAVSARKSKDFKNLRFRTYTLEKRVYESI